MDEDDSFFELQSTLYQLKSSTSSHSMEDLAELPETLQQLDHCLRKSNENITQLKESLKLVLNRESELQTQYDVILSKYNYSTTLLKGKLNHLISYYSLKTQSLEHKLTKFDQLRKEIEGQDGVIKDQKEELKLLREEGTRTLEGSNLKEKEYSQMRTTIERLNDSVKALNIEDQAWRDRVFKLRRELDETVLELDDSKTTLDSERRKKLKLQEELKTISSRYSEIDGNHKREKLERKRFENEMKDNYQQLKQKYLETEADRTTLEEENSKLQRDIERHKKRIDLSQEEVGRAKSFSDKEQEKKQEKIEKLEKDLNSKNDTIKKNSEEIGELERRINQLQKNLKSSAKKDSEISSLTEKLSRIQDKFESTEESHRTQQVYYKQIEDSYTEIEKSHQDLLKQSKSKESQLRSYQSELQSHKGQLAQLVTEKEELIKDFSKATKEYYHYEVTTKKAFSEVFLWKAALLEISCFKSTERPIVEDILRGLLGVAPERFSNYDPESKSHIDAIVARIKETITTKDIDPSIERAQELLVEITEKFRKEMAERRRLHALLQDIRGNIRVMCRVRPLLPHEKQEIECVQVLDTCQVKVSNPNTRRDNWFEFDRVFNPMDPQEVIYYEASDIVLAAMDGFNGCILAFGQTGSGKTHTMDGDQKDSGINFRAVKEVFDIAGSRSETHKYSVSVSISEVYNETIRDLLRPNSVRVDIREDSRGCTQLSGVLVKEVTSHKDLLAAIKSGKNNRAVGSTNVNEYSSRSHSIVTLYITCATNSGKEYTSKLNLIDLAGSERVCKSEAEGLRMQEACNINQSLTALGVVMHRLASKEKHIPYRDSKLTHLLKDSLSGDAKTLIIVTVSPSPNDVGETTSSLGFGSRVAKVEKGKARTNERKPTHKKRVSFEGERDVDSSIGRTGSLRK